ncbi:MAG TPA: ISAs1 family transposase [Nitrospiraceae bacterium]|nr:ISAs1 family transposase [Nitrospiraceae bacterium]
MSYDRTCAEILSGLEVRPIIRHERLMWDNLIRRHHYLGLHSLVGESIRYIAHCDGKWLALIGWSAAALKCSVRDKWIGWPPLLQWRHLAMVANNARFLILPDVGVPNMASRILSLNIKRLSDDWEETYNHPIWLVETFVDPRYFKGTCYKAAGWIPLGYTKGFAKSSNHYTQHDNPKIIFVRPIHRQAVNKLSTPDINIKPRKEIKPMNLSEKSAHELIQRILLIPDPRMARGLRHRKASVLAISICAILSGATSFTEIAEWAAGCSQNMLRRLFCRFDTDTKRYQHPSEPTIRRFMQAVDAEAVDNALYGWLQSLSGKQTAIAIDGKTLKGARQENNRQVHLLSAFLHQKGMVVAQRQVLSKTNEITTVRPLLESVDIKGCVVTMDALHTQKDTAGYLAIK